MCRVCDRRARHGLGASAHEWLLHTLALRAAERRRGDFRQGQDIRARAARIRRGWASEIALALLAAVTEGQRQRLMASIRMCAGWEGPGG